MAEFPDRPANVLALFDVDGTLTKPRNEVTPEMKAFMLELRKSCVIGIVGGSDLAKIKEQLGNDCVTAYDYCFGQNGLEAFKVGECIGQTSIKTEFDEATLQSLINFILHYVADLDIPVKRGTFVEFRIGMLNVSPIGRNCNQEERDAFEKYDAETKVREKMIAAIKAAFPELAPKLTFSIGGQISFDVFPKGWDKTFCLRYVEQFETVHFFGDKTFAGGNDHEIFESARTIGHTVTSPDETKEQCTALFMNK